MAAPQPLTVFATVQIEHKFVFSLDAHLQKALQIFHAILQSMEIEIPFGLQASWLIISVARLGYFWKFLVTNFHSQVDQIFAYFLGYFEKITF